MVQPLRQQLKKKRKESSYLEMAGYARYDDDFDEDNRRLVYGVLYDIAPALRIQDIEGLIKECFRFRRLEIYPGLADNEAFFAVNQDGMLPSNELLFERWSVL